MSDPLMDPFCVPLPDGARDRYWEAVLANLGSTFGITGAVAEQIVRDFRDRTDYFPVGEQLAIYHSSPSSTAYDLALQAARSPIWQNQLPGESDIHQAYEDFAHSNGAPDFSSPLVRP